MLVLSRKKSESIIIGTEVRLTVLDIKGDRVKLGISAPSHIVVNREEIVLTVRPKAETEATANFVQCV